MKYDFNNAEIHNCEICDKKEEKDALIKCKHCEALHCEKYVYEAIENNQHLNFQIANINEQVSTIDFTNITKMFGKFLNFKNLKFPKSMVYNLIQ